MGLRSGYHSETEPEIITPQAARLGAGGRSGPGRQSHGAASLGGPGLHSRRPNRATSVRRGNGLQGTDNIEEMSARLGRRSRPSKSIHHGEDIKAPLGGRDSARGPRHYFDEDDELEDVLDPPGRTQPRDGRDDLFGKHDRFGGESEPFAAAGARPTHFHPSNQHQGHGPRGRPSLQDDERYGGSRRGGGNRARYPSEDAHDEPEAGPSKSLVGPRDTKADGGSQEEAGRFIPYTFRMLSQWEADLLSKIFKVQTSKVKEWCDKDYIRMDKKRNNHTNIDPLLRKLPKKDRQRYIKAIQNMKNEREIEKHTGRSRRHVPTSYEHGFYAGQASVLHGGGTDGSRSGWY